MKQSFITPTHKLKFVHGRAMMWRHLMWIRESCEIVLFKIKNSRRVSQVSFNSVFLRAALTTCLLVPAFCAPPTYTVVDLGTLGGSLAAASGINDSGQVVGNSFTTGDLAEHPFLWSGGRMTDLGTLGGTLGEAFGVNGSGQVVGLSQISGDVAFHAFLVSGGLMRDLGTLPGFSNSAAASINASGQIAGYSYTNGLTTFRTLLFNGGVMTDLGTLGGANSFALGINGSTQVVGSSDVAGNAARRAFLFSGGVMHDLGTLGGTNSEAIAINEIGQVVGSADTAGNNAKRAFLYSGGVMHDLGTLGGPGLSTALGINDAGQIVGLSSLPGDPTPRAFLYSDGLMRNLNDLIAPNSLPQGVTLAEAQGINSSGQIVANSVDNFHAYLLTPMTPLVIISPTALPPGTVGVAYGPVAFVATGGTTEMDWAATGLPNGLFINAATGALMGTAAPGAEGIYPNARFTVIGSTGTTASITLSLTINPSITGPAPPAITSVSPNPVLGTSTGQSFCVNGSGFINGPNLKVRLTWPTGRVDLPVNFFNPNQLCLTFNFGLAIGNWTAQVLNADGQLSEIVFFPVTAPGRGMNTHLAVPQFVFGGNSSSTLYFSNTTNSLESVQVKFTDDTGAPLLVPLAGIGSVSSRIVNLNPGTTVLLEAFNGPNPATEGWADILLPPGVIGYGLYHQIVEGEADQETIFPFTPESSQTADFTFDDTSFTTAVAFLNPSNQETIVTVTAFGADGDEVGSTQLALAPHAKSASILKTYRGIEGISGKQGRVVVSVPNGAVSVLALRFGTTGFTDIPVNHR
jgi:probable HAF family extracellular repeat protein